MRGIIVSNGCIRDYNYTARYFEGVELVLCADGGAAHLKKLGVTPDILLGDFDSISIEDLEQYQNAGVQIMKFPAEKDMTDSELAVEIAIEKGCREIVLIGSMGTRFDHTLANIFLLKKMLDLGVAGTAADEYNEIRLIRESIHLNREPGMKVTLLPMSETVEGVTTKGLYYPLKDATLRKGSTWGVSNEFVESAASVTITSGELLVITSRD